MSEMRKSLYGFNRDDVVECIKELHNTFDQKESKLKEEIAELKAEIQRLNQERENILFEKTAIENVLREYSGKTAEIEQLSEDIGKLYLTEQADSDITMQVSQGSDELLQAENEKKEDINKTRAALEALKEAIVETSENFTKEVNSLFDSLNKVAAESKKETENKSQPIRRANSDIDIVIL